MRLNDVRDNGEGVRNTAVNTFPAEENFWNASDGPSGAGGGSGDSVFGSVDFTPFLEGSSFTDNDNDGYSECQGDCDDRDDTRNPFVGMIAQHFLYHFFAAADMAYITNDGNADLFDFDKTTFTLRAGVRF